MEKKMNILKAAIIGSGFMGSAHAEALRRIAGVEILAIASDDLSRAKEIAEYYDIPNVFDNWQDAIHHPQVQVVHNCTPNFLHFEINRAVIQAGKHILSEKPLTINSKDAAALVNLAKKKNVVTAINFNYRFYPLVQQIRQLISSGDLGSLYLIHGNYLQDWLFYDTDYNWRLETDLSGKSRAIADIGSHWCDLVQFVSGLTIEKVCADLTTIHKQRKKPKQTVETFKGKEETGGTESDSVPIRTEDAGSVLLHFTDGVRGVFTVSQVSAGRKNHLCFEIDGAKKSVYWNQEEPNQLWVGYREKGNEIVIKDPFLLDKNVRQYAHYPGGHPEGYADGPKNLFNNFYGFIRQGKDPWKDKTDFPTFVDGCRANKVVEAIMKSNTRKAWVKV
jgi:predicted dehydrogenase